jgi:hypothetical protein
MNEEKYRKKYNMLWTHTAFDYSDIDWYDGTHREKIIG